jgi:hypothetical protein
VLLAAIGALASVVAFLGRDLIKQRDSAVAGWMAQTDANRLMAEGIREANLERRERHRLGEEAR